jgi:hypothetical protein
MYFKSLLLIALFASSTYATEKTHENKQTEAPTSIFYGKILTIDKVMGYQYLNIDENGTKLWVAIATAPVKVGDKIGYDKRTIMKNFKSKSLNREFKEIIFASDVYLAKKAKGAPIKSLQDLLGLSVPMPSSKKIQPIVEKPTKLFVEKEFYTVEEAYMWRDALKNRTIKIKGKVQKVSKQIMKLDWVHIEDGTGSDKQQNNDLVFTTKNSKLKEGDTVVATGKVILNKDFGYGYFYKIIIQESSFTAQ